MTVQKATLEDIEEIAELFNLYRLFQKQESDREGARTFLKERLENEESIIFIAYDERQPVGFAQVYPTFSSVSMQKSWVLNDLYVKETARSKGHGEQLIIAVRELAKETGAKGVSLETGNDNFGAQRLYERIGFERESNLFYYLTV